jgi:hypothetical protein
MVAWRDLAAVVSRLEADAIEPTPENLLRHEAVVEALYAEHATLPVRFGTVMPDSDAVCQALRDRYDDLLADLRRLGNTVEFSITALWPTGRQASQVQRDENEADRESRMTAGESSGTAYLRARMIEQRHADMLRNQAEEIAGDITATTRPHTVDHRGNLSPSERIALRDVYLVPRDHRDAFVAAFDEVRARHREVRLLLSGPWPPYSFVTPAHEVAQ